MWQGRGGDTILGRGSLRNIKQGPGNSSQRSLAFLVSSVQTERTFTSESPTSLIYQSLRDSKLTPLSCRDPSTMTVALQTTFSLASNVTLFDLADRVQRCTNSCRASTDLCHLLGSQRRVFRGKRLVLTCAYGKAES